MKKSKKVLLILLILGISLLIVNLLFYFTSPSLLDSYFQKKSLLDLKKKSRIISQKWYSLFSKIEEIKKKVKEIDLRNEGIKKIFYKIEIDETHEGISVFDSKKELILWKGKVEILEPEIFDLNLPYFIIKRNNKTFLVSILKNKSNYFALFKILSFTPPIKTIHLKKYIFFEKIKNFHIQFFSYKEKTHELSNFFRKRNDIYLNKRYEWSEIWTLSFPLRDPDKNLLAVVTLNSLSPDYYLAQFEKKILYITLIIFIYLLICFSLFLTIIYKKTPILKRAILLIGMILNLTLIRLLLLYIFNFNHFSLNKSFILESLFKNDLDIILTSLYLAGIIYFSAHFFAEALKSSKKKLMIFLNLIPISFISVLLLILFFKFIKISIKISNINLKYSIIYLGWLFLVLSISTFIIKMHDLIKNKTQLIFHMILISILFFFSYKLNILSTKLIIIYTIFYFLLVIHSHSKLKISKEKILIFDLVVLTLFIYLNIHFLENEKKQKIANNVLAPIILELEEKANSILKESIMKLEKEEKLIIEFFKNPKMDNLSFYLWKKTPLSNYNWNSGIEMLNEEGKEIARFSFNLPSYYLSEYFLPIETKWIVTSQKMHFLGKGKRLLIGYRDWFENGNYLGRLLIYLSIDYDTLPFPFNKNPYNELIRPFSYPSEYKIFNVVILDSKGSFIFNPIKLNTGISLQLLNPAVASSRPIWSTLTERDRKYSALIFKNKGRFYLILYQNKSLRKHIVDYIKLFLIYSIFFSLFISLYLIIAKKIKNPFQSFSRKVYLFFLVIAILPLLFFSFFTQKFFSYQFSEQFREKAEAHLSTAQSVMEDFLALQKERKKIYEIFPNDLVFWISTTINNDVNLYKKGILVSSSKRELFELGLLPKIINGQTFYNIYWENRPYDIRREKIGDLTFYILTVPTVFTNQIFLLSLPFPSGKEEISLASQELIEFLIFSSIFIIGIAIFLAQSMGRIILKPIKKLLNATEEVSKGNLEIKIEHYSKDEIQTLINGFNSMIENLKRQQKEIAEMSKKIAWTEMARRIAHEIKNPLTPILLSAEQILKVYEDKSSHLDKTVKESAEYIIREAEHLRKIAQEFLIFSKEEELKKEKFNLKEIITKEISPYKKTFQKKIKFIEIFPEKDVYIYADREKLKISLRNVIINSIEAIHKKGEIKIRVWIEKNWINIEISDTGEGIKKEFLEKIFEPYFSTKEGGTGLGLSIAKKIIEQHKGEIKISSEIGKGTITLIKLPTYL